jgi:8-oxo-dGTP pyrophosphatase MutT (NUDIX family)
VNRIHLATGLLAHDRRVLLVASRYANHPQPLWNLPGGRQESHESLAQTVVREVMEETGLVARVGALAYVSESYDGDTHILNATFHLEATGDAVAPVRDDHVVAVDWVAIENLASRIAVRVVREPLVAYLADPAGFRYAAFDDAGITIEWE